MNDSYDLPVGGGYRMEKLMGRGGIGEVWRATAPGNFPAAVKLIRRPADHEERQREVRALEVIRNLHHHFLIRTYAYYSEPDYLAIVMELADGSLRDRLKECMKAGAPGIPADELIRYFREAAEALDYLHEKGVLHRDIKPDNILLLEGHVRLADFGLALHQDRFLMTVSGSGTPAYMAPEVWRGHASKQSDQYSLAYAYAELRLGHRPFSSTDYAAVMFDHIDRVPDLGDLPDVEREPLLRALAKNPDQRYPTCVDFVRALEQGRSSRTRIPTLIAPTGGPGNKGQATHLPHPAAATQQALPVPAGPELTPPTPALPELPVAPPVGAAAGEAGVSLVAVSPSEVQARAHAPTEKLAGERSVLAAAATPPTTQLTPPLTPSRPPVPWRWLVVLLLLVLLAGGAGAGVWAWWKFHPVASFTLQVPGPQTVRAGQEFYLKFQVERQGLDGPVRLTFSLPAGIALQPATIQAGAREVEVEGKAGAEAPREALIGVHASAGALERDAEVHLTITASSTPVVTPSTTPALFLPPGFRPVGEERVRDRTGREFYREIESGGADRPKVDFVLVEQKTTADPPSFYMMKTKVWRGLFVDFAHKHPEMVSGQWTVEPGQEKLPALGMTADEADRFAVWLGGRLPTTREWDRAAGFLEQDGRAGPARGANVAVGRRGKGPRPVDEATSDDVSPSGIRDLAGNGTEFTRNLAEDNLQVPQPAAPADALVILRGQRYSAPGPLLYSDLEYEQNMPKVQFYRKASPFTGFRVVIEPPLG